MIGSSLTEWIFIRFCVLLFRYTPLIYITALLIVGLIHQDAADFLSSPITLILRTLLLAEAIFFVFIYRPYQARLKNAAKHPTPLSRDDRRRLFNRCLVSVPSPEQYLQWWFLGAEIDEIRLENVREFFLWAFFERGDTAEDCQNPEVQEEIDDLISIFEQTLGRRLQPGRGNARCLRLTLDSIKTTYRSLLWYIIVFFIDQFTHLAFLCYGFEYRRRSRSLALRSFPPRPQEIVSRKVSPAAQVSYWYRRHSDEKSLPVVFFHGIGIGLSVYIRFLAAIHKSRRDGHGRIGVIAVEILPICFTLYSPIPTKAEFLDQMTAILDNHGWEDISVVSHSYGSVLTTHMLHSPALQHRIQSTVLIDPVTIMLHLPSVAYNFTRRRPKGANEWQLWYFASTDPGVALCLGRHFFWRENIIWKDELLSIETDGGKTARRVTVCLSGRDLIVDTAAVAKYLGHSTISDQEATVGDASSDKPVVVLFPDLDHAQIFDNRRECARVVEMVRSSCQR